MSARSPALLHPSLAQSPWPARSFPLRADRTTQPHRRRATGRPAVRPTRWCPRRWPARRCRSRAQPCLRTRLRTRRVSATSLEGVARSTRRTRPSSMASGRSSWTKCPAPPTITSSDFGSADGHALRVLHRREEVAVAAGDQGGHLRQCGQPVGLVVDFERVQELDQCGDGRVVHHLLAKCHDARADLLVAIGRRPQDRADHSTRRTSGTVHRFRRIPDGEARRLERRILQDLPQR